MFDLTPFATFEVTGPGSLAALQRLTTNQMDKPVGTITYTAILTPGGGIKCDLTVTRLAERRFMVVTGGAMGLHDLGWIQGTRAGRRLGDGERRHVGTIYAALGSGGRERAIC